MNSPTRSPAFFTSLYLVFFAAVSVALLAAGGAAVLVFAERIPATSRNVLLAASLAFVAAVVALGSGLVLRRANPRNFLLSVVSFGLLSVGTLALSEFAMRWFVPDWPAIGLHGLLPDAGGKAWGRAVALAGATGFNSWGQRDLNRSLRPPAGSRRIAFIGDSFLEESSTIPVSVATERIVNAANGVGNPKTDIVNLGVSATAPDEYYYRTKNIALPLGAQQCVVFFYEGNDFTDGSITLASYLGVAAVYPRDSLLSALGLRALNHLFTNRRRPLIAAWGAAGELGTAEQTTGESFRTQSDLRALVVSLAPEAQQGAAAAYLEGRDLGAFYEAMRNPDMGLFRSYYLRAALSRIGEKATRHVNEQPAYAWVRRTRDLCVNAGAGFLLVLVPEAFSVDARMQETWMGLADMKTVMASAAEAGQRLVKIARSDGIEVLDLHPVLAGTRGSYLNPDGHWSQQGVNLVSAAVAKNLERPPGAAPP